MKKSINLLAAVLLLAGGIYCFILARKNPPVGFDIAPAKLATQPQPIPTAASVAVKAPPSVVPANPVAVMPPPVVPTNLAGNAVAAIAPETDLQSPGSLPQSTVAANIRSAVRQYNQMWGGDPVGTNPEITSALSGNNPKHINFINTEAGMRVNSKGEMVDNWGTPYFFHQISGSEMEIHSAGPDKIMWTADDIVAR